jgi:hypothetical protein
MMPWTPIEEDREDAAQERERVGQEVHAAKDWRPRMSEYTPTLSEQMLLDGMYPGIVEKWAEEVAGLEKRLEEAERRAGILQEALTLIGDIAYDRDGHTGNADALGKLVDELHTYARNPDKAARVSGESQERPAALAQEKQEADDEQR